MSFGDLYGAERDRAIVTDAGFAVYALDPHLAERPTVSGWGTESEEDGPVAITHVVVSARALRGNTHIKLNVSSSPADPEDATDSGAQAAGGLASSLLDDALRTPRWQDTKDSERDRVLSEILADVDEQADRSQRSDLAVTVDGRTVTFALARDIAGAWCAATTLESVLVKITGRHVDPLNDELALVRIVEPSAYFRD